MKVYALSGGVLDADRAVIHPGDDSRRRVTLPVMQLLIDTGSRRILIDTGLPPAAAGDRDALQRDLGMSRNRIDPDVDPAQRIDRQLAALDLAPRDLDLVINSHFHFDHAGANAMFAGIPIAVQESELEAARAHDMPWFDAPDLQFQPVRGDWSPAPGIAMLHTPGHTPGHQSTLIRLNGRSILFTWDAAYTEEHWRENKLGPVQDIAAARASLARLHRIAEHSHARVIFGHDIVQWDALTAGRPTQPILLAAD